MKTVRDECLHHFVVFGERHLRYLLKEFLAHYHRERFHQGLGGQLVETGSGPWVMVDWEQGVYAGNTAKCGSGAAPTADCTTSGENPNPSVTFDVVTTLAKHDGTKHWQLKAGNAKSGSLAVSIDLPTLPKGYSPLKQEGGLGLGEGGAGDTNGTGGFSEGAVMAAETTDAVDNAIQKSIVSVYGK